MGVCCCFSHSSCSDLLCGEQTLLTRLRTVLWLIFQLLFFGFGFCSCLTLFLAVCGRDVDPFQLPLGDSPGSRVASEDVGSPRLWASSKLCSQPSLYRAPQLISYFCVVPIPLLPVCCGGTQQPCPRSNPTLQGTAPL